MNKLINFLEDSYLNLVSGLIGALAWSLHKKKTFWASVRSIISGSLTSVFLTPTIAKFTNINENYMAFLIGIVGMTFIEEVIVKNKAKITNSLKSIIKG